MTRRPVAPSCRVMASATDRRHRRARRIVIAMGLLLSCCAAIGAAPTTTWDLDTLFAHLVRKHPLKARFVEHRHISEVKGVIESSGVLEFAPPSRLVKRTLKPQTETFTFDGDTLSVAQGVFRRDLPIADARGIGALAIGIRGFVSGDLEALSAAFTLSLVGPESDWTVHCTPRASSASAILSHVHARGNLGQLRSIAVELANGDSSILTILPW